MMNHADILKQYAQEVSALYRTGVTTEHSFRGSLQTLLNAILPQYNAVNEPQRSACGAPDYALVGKKDRQPHAYIEAKDLFDNDLRGVNAKGHKAQFDRYKQALPRIAFTDYLTFVFYVDGAETASINLLTLNAKGTFQVADGERFISMLTDWANCNIQPITTASRLAEIMAYKARLLNEAILKTLQGEAISNRLQQGEAIFNRSNQGEAISNRLRNNARKQAVENRFSLHYIDLYGTRKAKYATLDALDLPCSQTAAREPSDSRQSYWQILTPTAPNYFFVPKDFTLQEEYEKGIKLDELFKENNIGIITGNDKKLIGYTIEQLQQSAAEVDSEFNEQYIKPINYRPFDKRYIYYRTDLIERARAKIMQHMLQENVGLVLCRQLSGDLFYHTFVSDSVIDNCVISNATKERCYLFPLYLYDSNGTRHLNMQGEAIFNRLPKDIKDIYEDSQAITNQAIENRFSLEENQAIENRFSLQNRSSLYLSQTLSVNETRANLPHWHQNGKLQFVTFRLADALPHEKWLQLQEQKIIFEKENPKPWNDEILHQYYKLFGSKIDEWLDANYGSCILKNPQVRKIVEDALLFFNEKRYILHSYVIMPNHVHVLFELLEENKTSEILQSWKRHTANQINKLLGTAGSLWQKESFDRLIRDGEHYKRVCRYIVNNPKGLSPDCYTLQGEAICNRLQSQGEAICNRFINNDEGNNGAITNRFSLDFFAYIYAILHSPSYRERYKEFLKIDFPRIPIPTDMAEYQRLVGLGKELIDLHLMQQAIANRFSLPNYPIAGSNVVEFVKFVPDEQAITNRFSLGRLYINSTQYFDHVPEVAYNLYIGGYQPAQKWLIDRKGRALTLNDIRHYQRLLSTLHRTAEIMQEIG